MNAVARDGRSVVKKAVQNTLLMLYPLISASGAMATPRGREIVLAAYNAYKSLLEPDLSHLRALVRPGAWLVDIGANVGYYSRKFCAWVSDGGRVHAFEPERENFQALVQIAAQPAIKNLTECRRVRLDTVMAELTWPAVSLIKVDVQGAEARVLEGAHETLVRNRPVLVMEIDDRALDAFGSSPRKIEQHLAELGYRMFATDERGFRSCLDSVRAAEIRLRLGYVDFVFVPRKRIPQTG